MPTTASPSWTITSSPRRLGCTRRPSRHHPRRTTALSYELPAPRRSPVLAKRARCSYMDCYPVLRQGQPAPRGNGHRTRRSSIHERSEVQHWYWVVEHRGDPLQVVVVRVQHRCPRPGGHENDVYVDDIADPEVPTRAPTSWASGSDRATTWQPRRNRRSCTWRDERQQQTRIKALVAPADPMEEPSTSRVPLDGERKRPPEGDVGQELERLTGDEAEGRQASRYLLEDDSRLEPG